MPGQRVVLFKGDLDRNALDDLVEIARRVFRRQQAELGAAGRRKTLDPAEQDLAGKAVDLDFDALARRHFGKLSLLEVRHHPDILQRHKGHELGARPDELPLADAAISDHPGNRRANLGMAEIDLGQGEVGLALLDRRFELALPCVDDRVLVARRHQAGRRHAHGGTGLARIGQCAVMAVARRGAVLDQVFGALKRLLGARQLGLGKALFGLGLGDDRGLQRPPAGQDLQLGQAGCEVGPRLLNARLEFRRLDDEQRRTLLDALIVADQNRRDIALDLGADRRDFGADIGIVG